MSCQTIIQQIKDLKSSVLSTASALRNTRSEINGINVLAAGSSLSSELQRAINLVSQMRTIITLSNNDAKTARDLSNQAKTLGCGIDVSNAALDVLGLAETIIDSATSDAGDGDRKIKILEQNLNKEQAAASAAASKQNNAGTGTPGTAGQGAGADDLTEVTVTGKKTPPPVTPTGGTEDDLTEVTVTGKKVPDTVNPTDGLDPVTVTGKRATDPGATGNQNTVPGINKARSQAALKDTTNFEAKKDWRVRLSLSPGANYLYKAQNPGILAPLLATDGVLFPYTPAIQVSYNASYDPTQLTHSNFKFFQYTGSNVDNINITCDFTAQDTSEANYVLAVIHFFRSITKMFYGQDENPKQGTPPPLCYLFGLGEYQFNAHPLAVTSFNYSLPNNVDYIRANLNESGLNEVEVTAKRSNLPIKAPNKPKIPDQILSAVSQSRLAQGLIGPLKALGVDLVPGGGIANPNFQNNTGFNSVVPPGTNEPTYVPTSIQISISCVPIVSRYDISNTFSLRDYATGQLLRGVKRSGGGIW